MKCDYCGREEVLPFKCQYCQRLFCAEHRLPENHNCAQIGIAKAPKEEPPPYEYKVTLAPSHPKARFTFSLTEIQHLTVSALLIVGVGLSMMFGSRALDLIKQTPVLVIAASAMFVGLFLLHEIAHKLVAQRYGLWAEFRLIWFGALLTLISAIPLSPFKIIAPGAVMIAGSANQKIMGKTAVAGPLTNIVLSLVSLPIFYFAQADGFAHQLALWSLAFNAWIALFNVLPVAMLDGLKVFHWSKIAWAVVFVIALTLTIITFQYL